MASQRKVFNETIGFLLEELTLAMKWERPSILLAVHKSRPSQSKAENALKNKLQKIGKNVIDLKITSESSDAADLILASNGDVEKNVFFISNIDQGGGEDGRNAYRALNLHRETFVENKIKVVFWLTINEELKLPMYAPDFWAFRHRVFEFSSTHQPRKIIPPVGLLLWGTQNSGGSTNTAHEKIVSQKQLLSELPDSPESLSTRIEVFHDLGFLYWTLGDVTQASAALTSAVELAKRDEFTDIRIRLLNEQAIVLYENGNYQEAYNIYTDLVDKNPKSSLLRINFAVVLSALGKNYLASSQARKALKLDPLNFEILYVFGYLNLNLGKLDEAVDLLRRSNQLAPTTPKLYEMLGICYNRIGLFDDARDQLKKASDLQGDRVLYLRICEEALFGNLDDAAQKLKEAMVSGEIYKQNALRDPSLNAVFGHSKLQEVVG